MEVLQSSCPSHTNSSPSGRRKQQEPRRTLLQQLSAASLPLTLLLLVLCAGVGSCAPAPDSSDEPPSNDNTLEMLVVSSRASNLPSLVVVAGGGIGGNSGDDLFNYYLPVIMAEMAAPVSTRDPSIIRVSCRGGFMEDQTGGCRPTFVPTPYYPRNTRPNRHTSIASILPRIRSPPTIPRPQVQTQRDLIRAFNTSRNRPAWFGRSLNGKPSKGPSSSSYTGVPLAPQPYPLPNASSSTTTTTTPSPTTTMPEPTTPDCDD